MPSRLVSVAILLYWLVAMEGLVTRDLLPELSVGSPPDLRTIAVANEGDVAPVRWGVLVVDNPADPDSRRSVGQAVTASHRKADGWVEMTSNVIFDSGRLLGSMFRTTALAPQIDQQIEFRSQYHVDPTGNLRSFHADVRMLAQPSEDNVLRIDGQLKGTRMEVNTGGLLVNRSLAFEYRPRSVVQSQFGPLDRLPGLQVGQRWDEQVSNPLTGQMETVRAEVKRRTVIHWDQSPVSTLEVVHTSKAATARTWVRPDGLVLRQEVALPLMRLVLERQARLADRDVEPPLLGPAGRR